jgi:hypothetical protein
MIYPGGAIPRGSFNLTCDLERKYLMSSYVLRRAGLGVLAALVVACGADRADAQTTLRYKFKKGEQLHYEMEHKIAMSTSFGGRDFSFDLGQTIDMTWNVADVDAAGKAKMTQKITRIRCTMDGGAAGKIEYDSKDDKEIGGEIGKIMSPLFRALAGAEITLAMDAQGKVSDVKLSENLAKAGKNLPPAAAAFAEMLSEDSLKRMIDQSGLRLPDGPVAKGKSWNQQFEMKSAGGKMNVATTNTYEGPVKRDGKELERVAIQPKLTLEADPGSPAKVTLKSQDAKGSAYFDNAAGRLMATNMSQNLEIVTSFMGQESSQKLKQTMSMKLVDK